MTAEHRYYMSRSGRYVNHEAFVSNPRNYTPVVVIDPEDREQVERLCRLYASVEPDGQMRGSDFMAAALREFANPTKPRRQDALTEYRDEKTGRQYFVKVSAAPEFEAAETDLKRMAIAEVVIDSYGVAKNRKGWSR